MFFLKKKDIPQLEDEDLIKRYKEHHELFYIGELFKKHSKQVYGTCLFYLEDKEEAKDHVMQVFEKLIQELKVRDIQNFKAWLSFVVRNHCISSLRKKKSERLKMNSYYGFELQEANLDNEMAIERISDEQMLEDSVLEALNELSPKQKLCVRRFYLENKSYAEISAETSYSLNEVKSYIQNGKRNLKLYLEAKLNFSHKSPESYEE